MKRLTTIAAILLTAGLLVGCTPDSGIREIAARNSCDSAVQVDLTAFESSLEATGTHVPPGETVELGGFGDIETVHARWGPTGVELDDSFPVFSYEPDELIAATDEEEQQDGYEFYFVIEGSACP